jgi:hypothetical protein
MAISPSYYSRTLFSQVEVSTANANYDGTGTLVAVATGQLNSSRVEKLKIQATGTPTVGAINLFIDNGTTVKFYKEIPVTATARFTTDVQLDAILPDGYILKASTLNAETFNLFASGGDY